jgi:hypothetical protein
MTTPNDIIQPKPDANTLQLNNLSPEDQSSFAQSLEAQFNNWKQQRQAQELIWKRCWNAYLANTAQEEIGTRTPKSYYNPTEDNQTAGMNRPLIYQSIEALHANLMSNLFPPSGTFFSVIGETEADHQQAKPLEDIMKTKLETAHFQEAFSLYLKQLLVCGTSILSVPWKKETQLQETWQPIKHFGMTIGYEPTLTEEMTYDAPEFQVLDLFNTYLDPQAKNPQQATLIHQLEKTLDELEAQGWYSNLEAIAEQLQQSQAQYNNKGNKQDTTSALQAEKLTLLECWGDFQFNGKTYHNHVATLIKETSTLIRLEPIGYRNGQKPFVIGTLTPIPHQLYGLGAVEKSLGLQNAINLLTNQKLDALNLTIHPPFTYLIQDDIFDPTHLSTQPGALIPVKDHNTIRPLPMPTGNLALAYEEIQDLKQEILETTGSLRLMTNTNQASTGGNQTATEINAYLQSGERKYSQLLSHIEQTSVEPLLNKAFSHLQQFWHTPETLRLLQPDGSVIFKPVQPKNLKRLKVSFKVTGSRGMLQNQEELNHMLFFIKVLQNLPEIRTSINFVELAKAIYDKIGLTNIKNVFFNPFKQPPSNPPIA